MSKENMITLTLPESAWDTLRETLEMDAKSSAFDSTLREEIEEALEQVSEETPQIVIVIEGGCVQEILSASPLECTIVDYDAEGNDEEDIVEIPQGDLTTQDAVGHCESAVLTAPERISEIVQAIQNNKSHQPVQCSHEGCQAHLTPGGTYHSTFCGTFCEEHIKNHAKDCEICRNAMEEEA